MAVTRVALAGVGVRFESRPTEQFELLPFIVSVGRNGGWDSSSETRLGWGGGGGGCCTGSQGAVVTTTGSGGLATRGGRCKDGLTAASAAAAEAEGGDGALVVTGGALEVGVRAAAGAGGSRGQEGPFGTGDRTRLGLGHALGAHGAAGLLVFRLGGRRAFR